MSAPTVTVAVDAMGGDHAPAAVVAGAVDAARRGGVRVTLVGATDAIRAELAPVADAADLPIDIVDAPEVVGMAEVPLAALRRKRRASIRVAADLVSSGRAQAAFSAGHTGAAMLAAHSAFGLLQGAERPALAVVVPTPKGAAVLLDAGANVDCRPEHLERFGVMGAAYAAVALHVEQPRVGLLSIGEEAGKGNDLVREAHARLAAAPIHFVGNIEARDLFAGHADVIVCDGFTGNVALKVGEGLVDAVEQMLREELGAEVVSQIGSLLARRAFTRFKQRVDSAEYGGAPLLGVSGLMIVGHGRSTPQAVRSGIGLAARLASGQLVEKMAAALRNRQES
ncbi:MAG TPA: phosphate acyltransferase PlsX [Vicinamibacterales bacterium]|nr:phosphate acyltransferase PlsX [Vicinamibacterales bacterium]